MKPRGGWVLALGLFGATLLGGCSSAPIPRPMPAVSAPPPASTSPATSAVAAPATSSSASAAPMQTRGGTAPSNYDMPPLAHLTAAQRKEFKENEEAFGHSMAGQGLGPVYNGTACVTCHVNPIGAATNIRVTRFGKMTGTKFDPLTAKGGPLLHTYSDAGLPTETVPEEANATAVRRSTHLFGLGLVEAIPDDDIVAFAKRQAREHPAQAGQLNYVPSPSDGKRRVGRFGWKCQQALLLDMAADAMVNELGVSNAVFPFEPQPGTAARAIAADKIEDRPDAAGLRRIDRTAAFIRFLAPLPRAAPDAAGAALFASTGCAVCHTPSYTARSPIAAIDGQPVAMYSDFLLHDIGSGDGIAQNGAPPNKMRTAPLAGVARQPFFLHDGSAKTVEEAVERHAGQAATAKENFQHLSPQDRARLLNFVQSL